MNQDPGRRNGNKAPFRRSLAAAAVGLLLTAGCSDSESPRPDNIVIVQESLSPEEKAGLIETALNQGKVVKGVPSMLGLQIPVSHQEGHVYSRATRIHQPMRLGSSTYGYFVFDNATGHVTAKTVQYDGPPLPVAESSKSTRQPLPPGEALVDLALTYHEFPLGGQPADQLDRIARFYAVAINETPGQHPDGNVERIGDVIYFGK